MGPRAPKKNSFFRFQRLSCVSALSRLFGDFFSEFVCIFGIFLVFLWKKRCFAIVMHFWRFFIKKHTGINLSKFSFTSFFLGVGFMLMETKGITELAKIYGSTWLVVSIVIISVLFMAYIANLLIIKNVKISNNQIYFLKEEVIWE